jgi:hypothetical protein
MRPIWRHPRFATDEKNKNVRSLFYAGIPFSELKEHGPEGILTKHIKTPFGWDMGHLAESSGVRLQTQDWHDQPEAWNAMVNFRRHIDSQPRPNQAVVNALGAELRSDLLGSINDVMAAANDSSHAFHHDVKMIVLSIEGILGITHANADWARVLQLSPTMTTDAVIEKCQTEGEKLQSDIAKMFYFNMATHVLGTDPTGTDPVSEKIWQAIWRK